MKSFFEMTNKVAPLIRATGKILVGNCAGTQRPDIEVPERARRRMFTAKYKLEILAAYDAAACDAAADHAAADGEKDAWWRREGLYSSHTWRGGGPGDAGALTGLAAPR